MQMSRRFVMSVTVLAVVLFLGGGALGQSFQTSRMMGPMMQSPATDQMMAQMMGKMMQDPQMMKSMIDACARAMQDPQVQQRIQEMMQSPAMQQMMDQMLRQMPR